jgi:hypothetical protein
LEIRMQKLLTNLSLSVSNFKRIIALTVVIMALPTNVLAISATDLHAVQYDTAFYSDEQAAAACSSSTVGVTLPTGPVNFPANTLSAMKPVLTDIRSKQAFYQQRASVGGVPWELIAALEYRENNDNIDPSIDPLNGHKIDGYPYTNVDTKRTFTSYDEVWASVIGHITGNAYNVKIPANGGLSADDVAKIATSWRYGEKLEIPPAQGDNIPAGTTYLNNSYAFNGLDAQHALGTMNIIGFVSSKHFSLEGIDDRLGVLTIYLALTGGGVGTIGIGCGGTPDGSPQTNSSSTKLPYADKVLPAFGFSVNIIGGHNMTYFSQDQDSRWSSSTAGGLFSPDIATCGCGPTSLAMIISTLSKTTVTPDQMVAVQKSFGGINGNCGTAGTGSFPAVAKHYALNAKNIGTDWAQVDDTIKNKKGLVAVSMHQSIFGGDHYVVIRGIAANGDYLVANPLMGTHGGFAKTTLDSAHPQSDFNINPDNGMVAFWP